MSNDLRLNSIDRFVKESERLVLEEHSHCEVPAGCGGVVLRWRNPNDGTPVYFVSAMEAELEGFLLDGEPIAGTRTRLTEGEHVLSVVLGNASAGPRAFGLYTAVDDPAATETRLLPSPRTRIGEWRFALVEPEADWAEVGFRDDGWSTLPASNAEIEEHRWMYDRIREHDAELLELPAGAERVWIRCRFTTELG